MGLNSMTWFSERRSAPAEEIDQQDHNGEHQENVNEATERVRAHQTQQPQHQENYKNRPKHRSHLIGGIRLPK